MTGEKRLLSVLLIICLAIFTWDAAIYGRLQSDGTEDADSLISRRDTLYFWYADENLTDFINSAAVRYNEMQSDVRVMPVCVSGLEYLESVNRASVQEEDLPDLYLLGNDSLEKAYLAGLAAPVAEDAFAQADFPDVSLHAVTYDGRQIAWPFYFETSAFLYNETYLEDWAASSIEAEADAAEGEAAQQDLDDGTAELAEDTIVQADTETDDEALAQEIAERVAGALPATFDDILDFSYTYDAPEGVEAVLEWDVTDIFYNYFFVGNYINVGGADGDDDTILDVYNDDAAECLQVYQDLNQFFAIDTEEISYETVLEDFLAGRILYTVVTSDALTRLADAEEDGTFTDAYGVLTIPDISTELSSGSLSVTQCLVVNGYSTMQEEANKFAAYLVEEESENLYTRTGKLPVYAGVLQDPAAAAFYQEYERSVPIPKMMETSNYWVELEIAFARIWDGADPDATLRNLAEELSAQIQGQ